MTLYSRSCDSKVSHSTLPKTSTPIQSSVAASSQSTPTSQSQSLKTQEPIKEYDIVLNHFTINETNNTYNLLLNSLQRNLSQYLFKPHTLQLIQEDLKEFLNAKVIEQNFAILKHFTQVNSNQGKTLQEFSILSTAFTQLHFIQNFAPIMDNLKFTSSEPSLLLKYERDLYPWLLNSIEHLSSSFRGKGIVITTGNFHFKLALLLVKTLRNVLNCTLPIEVTIANQQDLRSDYQAELSKFSNLKIVDLSLLLKENELKGVNGWWFKAYSILLSSFAQVIFMDADVLFMVDPNLLFNSKVFEEYGVMIFRDRQIHLGNDYENLVKAFPFASNTLKNTALWQKSSTHEAESGVLVYDKMRKSAFYALLATCNLAREPMQKHVTEFFHGKSLTQTLMLIFIINR